MPEHSWWAEVDHLQFFGNRAKKDTFNKSEKKEHHKEQKPLDNDLPKNVIGTTIRPLENVVYIMFNS